MEKENIGLKIGLEIHQQIDTGKLFCRCPSMIRQDKPDITIKRRLYAAAGETGVVDIAAAYEQTRAREFIYEGYSDTNCEIEFDDSPPQEMDSEALRIALQIALLLNAKPLHISQIMRKTVVNGSCVSGFQRTMLIAKDGYVEVKGKKIGIQSICLEEDAAREIKQTEKEIIFRLDRLGIPLVEIATAPDITSPEEAKAVALKIGEILRSCKVKRGIGTIRQDVNMSIKGGERVEIKGVQDPPLIQKTIETEIIRQRDLLAKGKKMKPEVRRAEIDGTTTFLRPLPGAARMYPETDLPLVKISSELIKEIKESLPKVREDTIKDLEALGLHSELANVLIQKKKLELFNRLLDLKIKPALIARTIALVPDSIKAHYNLDDKQMAKLTDSIFFEVLEAFKKNKITKDAIELVLLAVCKDVQIKEAIAEYKKLTEAELEKKIKYLIMKKQEKLKKGEIPRRAFIGFAVSELKGRASGEDISKLVVKLITKFKRNGTYEE